MPAAFASAQLTTDQVPWERTVPIKDEVRGEMERSRIELGPVRVLPWIAVRNFGYNDNIYGSSEDPVGDWIATVGAGARLYVPVGSKTFLRMDALPEYTWYKHLGSRNQFGGRAQAQYLMFFNRLSADLTASYTDDPVSILSSEVPATVERIGWDGKANVELDMTHRISIFAGAEVLRERIHEPSGASLDGRMSKCANGRRPAGLRHGSDLRPDGWRCPRRRSVPILSGVGRLPRRRGNPDEVRHHAGASEQPQHRGDLRAALRPAALLREPVRRIPARPGAR